MDTQLSDFYQSKITLKNIWGFVSQKRMDTVTVIKHFNIPDYVTSGTVPGSINDIRDPFGFKKVEKIFHHGISYPERQRPYLSEAPCGDAGPEAMEA